MEANVGSSFADMLMKRAMLLLRGLELVPRPHIFTVLDCHKIDVSLVGYELTRVPDPGQRLLGWCCC